MDEVFQYIMLHPNHIILVLNNTLFNYVINYFGFYDINDIIPD